MSKSATTVAALAFALATGTTVTNAGSYTAGCTNEPQSKWMKITDVQSKAVELGYSVSKAKVSGSCFEIYAIKGSARFELFFNPVTATIVHTEAK